MATKRKFTIPSITQMENSENQPTQVKSLFRNHSHNGSNQASVKTAVEIKTTSNPRESNQINNLATTSVKETSMKLSGENSQNSHKVAAPAVKLLGGSSQNKHQVSAPAGNLPGKSSQNQHQGTAHAGQHAGQKSSTSPTNTVESLNTNTGSTGSSPQKKGKTNSIIVNSKQRGNPIIKFIRNVPWEFGDIIPDYQLGQTSCALFLSLRYHHLNPEYIHVRLKQLGQNYSLRVLLLQVDVKDPYHSLKELARICILADCTLMLAWSAEEAGRYLETYKAFENKPADLIKEQTDSDFLSKLTDTLTSVKSVNRTDVMTLLNTFGSFENIVQAGSEDLSLCPGFGPQKAQRLHDIFHEPFLKQKKNTPQKNQGKSSGKQDPS